MTKSELRKIYLDKRRSLSFDEMSDKSEKIADRFFESFDPASDTTLHCFVTTRKFNEIDTSIIYKRLWTDFPSVRTVAPVVNFNTGELESFEFGSETKFVENHWGISEVPLGEHVKTDEIDIVIVPLLCFDGLGHRVGYGKGFYDKFLAKCRPNCKKIGVSNFPPVDLIEDVGSHDVRLDLALSPEQIFTFQ